MTKANWMENESRLGRRGSPDGEEISGKRHPWECSYVTYHWFFGIYATNWISCLSLNGMSDLSDLSHRDFLRFMVD